MTEHIDRRNFLKAAGTAALGTLAVSSQSTAKQHAYPFVDGLCLDLPDAPEIKASGLSAFVFDASAGAQVKTPDGSPKWLRDYNQTLKVIAGVRAHIRSMPSVFLATDGREIECAFK